MKDKINWSRAIVEEVNLVNRFGARWTVKRILVHVTEKSVKT